MSHFVKRNELKLSIHSNLVKIYFLYILFNWFDHIMCSCPSIFCTLGSFCLWKTKGNHTKNYKQRIKQQTVDIKNKKKSCMWLKSNGLQIPQPVGSFLWHLRVTLKWKRNKIKQQQSKHTHIGKHKHTHHSQTRICKQLSVAMY